MPSIADQIAALAPSALIELFEVDMTSLDGDLVRFHAGTNKLGGAVVWQGNEYLPYPIVATGFDFSAGGQLPRPKLTVANVSGLITGYILDRGDILGAKVTRKRTLAEYLDAVNFPGTVNPSADPTAFLPDDIYFIDRKSNENKVAVEFELAAALDLAGVRLPRRQIVANVCPWLYKGPECGYVPGDMFEADDTPTADPLLDRCGKRLTSCKLRFGEFAVLPYGGFPGATLVRIR